MRILFSIIALCFCVLFADKAEADYLYHSTYLVNKIKPNLTVRSKPTSVFSQTKLMPIKLASVQFLTDGTQLKFDKVKGDVKSQCAALGYVLHIDKCGLGNNLSPSYLCSSELPDVAGAENYTSGCCNTKLYTAASASQCTDNATATGDYCYWGGSKKYRCTCDKSRYPYSNQDGEACSAGQVFDYTDVCKIRGSDGSVISEHYASCCKVSTKEGDGGYEQCDASNHEVGWGKSCRINGGATLLYEKCVCSSNYQTPCESTRLIDGSDYCKLDGTIYTRESNCESRCTYTSETNIDSYLQDKAWHCLYEKDGATIKDAEGSLCYNPSVSVAPDVIPDYDTTNVDKDKNYFDDCVAQGFTKSRSDCYVEHLILYCPNDSSKVWCLDGKYCSGYDVGNIDRIEACNVGANITFCGSKDQGLRCRYKMDECNACWNDGIYNGTCSNLDNTKDTQGKYLGYSLVDGKITANCCKFGYYMEDGICKPNVCDKDYYPYALRPDSTLGTVEECYEADASANLGYKAYFGYANCRNDEEKGESWMQDPNNSRRCVCNRTSEKLGYLPFGIDDYFGTNGDDANPGFNAGGYGLYRSCSDPDGTYYGYTMCYIGRKMTENGECIRAERGDYRYLYPYYSMVGINESLNHWGYPAITNKSEPRTSEDAYCIHKYTHCEDRNGRKLGDDEVCALVPEGCNLGYEEACNDCYHKSSVAKGNDGLYHINTGYLLTVNTYWNNSRLGGMTKCPKDYFKSSQHNLCYGICYTKNFSGCFAGEILVDDATNYQLGVVYYNKDKTLYLHSLQPYKYDTWDNAVTDIAAYAPEGYETHPIFGKGKWIMPRINGTITIEQVSRYVILGVLRDNAMGYLYGTWLSPEIDDKYAYYRTYEGGEVVKEKSGNYYYSPHLIFTY